jgi:hypothetical protein
MDGFDPEVHLGLWHENHDLGFGMPLRKGRQGMEDCLQRARDIKQHHFGFGKLGQVSSIRLPGFLKQSSQCSSARSRETLCWSSSSLVTTRRREGVLFASTCLAAVATMIAFLCTARKRSLGDARFNEGSGTALCVARPDGHHGSKPSNSTCGVPSGCSAMEWSAASKPTLSLRLILAILSPDLALIDSCAKPDDL